MKNMTQLIKRGLWLFPTLLFGLCITACPRPLPEINSAKYVAPSPDKTMRTPEDRVPMKMANTHQEALSKSDWMKETTEPEAAVKLSLPELIDFALRNSPATRLTWAQARVNAANWGRSRSTYWPQIDGSVVGAAGQIPAVDYGGRSYIAVGVALEYLLLDFGGRSAAAESARQALFAANWNHNQAIQDLLRNVPQAYYEYLSNKAQVSAEQENLKEAQTTLRSTEERRKAGVSTIADVLQARASASQVEVNLAQAKGDVAISKGKLATVIGWPANQPFEIGDASQNLPVNEMHKNVDDLITAARSNRPAIAVVQAQVRQKEADLLKARALPYPKLTVGGQVQYQRFRHMDDTFYYGTLNLSIPIFHGFDMENAVRAARAELDAAIANLKIREDTVIKEVWDAYHNFKTVLEQLKASQAMLVSAKESYNVSLARYRAGAADIVELLNAQSTLASARSQVIDSRMGVYINYAELVHAVGQEIPEIEEKDVTYGQN